MKYTSEVRRQKRIEALARAEIKQRERREDAKRNNPSPHEWFISTPIGKRVYATKNIQGA